MARKKFEFILSASTQGWNKINRAKSGLNAFTKEVKGGSTALGDMRGKIAMLSGAALGLAGVLGAGFGISSMVTDVVRGNKELENMARTAGLGVGDFAAYAHAVKSVGFESDKLADISKDVKDKIGDFIETGGGEFKDFFENIATQAGITAEELIKLSGPDALIAIKKAMDDVNVSAENQVFYLEAIANDASLLIPLLENEGKALKDLAQNAKEMGISISNLDHQELLELNDVLKEFRGNMEVTRREVVLAMAPAIKKMAEYLSENNEEIREFAVIIAESAGATVQWVIENRAAIVTVAKITAAVVLLSATVRTATTLISGIRAATLAMAGVNVSTWLASYAAGLKGVQIASLGAAAGIGAAAGATLAFIGGYSIGKKIDEWEYFRSVVGANKDALAEVPEKFRQISEATGVTIKSFDDLNEAQKKGLIEFDDVKGEWVKGAGEMAAAVEQSATDQERVTGAKLEQMKAAYKKYADEVKKLQDQIAGREQSLAEQLRELSRSGMSELGAWRDRKKEAEEYYRAAQKAAKAGDYEGAVKLADKAKEAYADLNTEVKNGEKVQISQATALKNAMTGVEKAGELGIDILKKQEEAARDAAAAINKESGGRLAEQMPEIAKQIGQLEKRSKEYGNAIDMTSAKWSDAFVAMTKDGKSALSELERKFRLLERDRHVNVYIKEVKQRALGGLAGTGSVPGFAGGGSPMYFPRHSSPLIRTGSSKKDDVPAMLSWREFIQPESSVDYYGVDFMERIRRRLFPRALAQRFATGGTPAGPVSLRPSSSGAAAAVAGDTFNITVNAGNGTDGRSIARQVMDEIERARRRRS